MPKIRQISDSKRRSRTGCLPCRKRRRKCDEQKPACRNCTSRNASCSYPRHSFVFDSHSAQSDSCVWNGRLPVSPAVATPIAVQDGGDSSVSVTPVYQVQQPLDNALDGVAAQSGNEYPSPRSTNSIYTYRTQDPSNRDKPHVFSEESTSSFNNILDPRPDSASATRSPRIRSNIEAEAIHLTSFVHDIVPWIVSTCPGSKFASSVISLAERQPVVRSAMIALVRARFKGIPASYGYGNPNESRQDESHSCQVELNAIENQLLIVGVDDPLAMSVARSLIAVGRLVGSRPAEWASARGEYPQSQVGFDEPLRYLLQMQAKTELASCILRREAPSMLVLAYLELSISSVAVNSAIREAYLACLSQLAQCLHLVYHRIAKLSTALTQGHQRQHHPSPSSSSESMAEAAETWSTWYNMWSRCVRWYQTMSPEMQPILGLSSNEAFGVTTSDDEGSTSFPIEIYSTPIALQSNMAIHLSFMVLLAHKPRMPKLARSELRLGSETWHAQKMAGMAVWNEFNEQYDPLFVAALLLVAEKMTHESQQTAILNCFGRVGQKTGIVLDEDVARLRDVWRLNRHGYE